jgi:hypothetical protein
MSSILRNPRCGRSFSFRFFHARARTVLDLERGRVSRRDEPGFPAGLCAIGAYRRDAPGRASRGQDFGACPPRRGRHRQIGRCSGGDLRVVDALARGYCGRRNALRRPAPSTRAGPWLGQVVCMAIYEPPMELARRLFQDDVRNRWCFDSTGKYGREPFGRRRPAALWKAASVLGRRLNPTAPDVRLHSASTRS